MPQETLPGWVTPAGDESGRRRWPKVALPVLVIACILLAARWAGNTTAGTGDFRAYWTASRLFSDGRNPCDRANVLEAERSLTDHNKEWPVMAWNPPTLWVLMLPLARLRFDTARVVWLLINLVLLITSALLLHRVFFPQRLGALVIFCLFAVLFPPALVAIMQGQVTLLVLFGMSAALFLLKRKAWLAAGALLILTSPKPHLVMLVVPYLLLHLAVRGKWGGWLGLGLAGTACVLILFALRPGWIGDYLGYLEAPPTDWRTPTVGGLFRSLGAGSWVQFAGLGFLALLPLLLTGHESPPPEDAVAFLTLVTVPTTFFGWSYDQSILLIPMAQMARWLSEPGAPLLPRLGVTGLVAGIVAGNTVHRIVATNEVEFLWVPLAIAAVYGLSWMISKYTPASCAGGEVRQQGS